jgi:hypothetical protein
MVVRLVDGLSSSSREDGDFRRGCGGLSREDGDLSRGCGGLHCPT